MPYDPERHHASASYRTKQLIVLASDLLAHALSADREPPDSLADELVERRVLPACYRSRYDNRFMEVFRRVLGLARNALVSDVPFLHNTACELAGHAIFHHAIAIADAAGAGVESEAAAVDERLPEQLSGNGLYLSGELHSLQEAVLEDTDVLVLFSLPEGAEPDARNSVRIRPEERMLMRLENWLVPFGSVPRPFITYDARAWPLEL